MYLTGFQTMIMIVSVALGTMLTRFLPFLLFPEHKKAPEFVNYLGKVLPPAMMGLLVVYCLRGVSVTGTSHGIPEAVGILAIIILHKWKNNVLISICGGTAIYMFLVQVVFC